MTSYTGPCTIECPQKCDVPEGFELTETPPTRHAWSDVISCPKDDCQRTLLITKRPEVTT